MKTRFSISLLCVVIIAFGLQACKKGKYDQEGRLMLSSLTSSSGDLNLSFMLRADSASVLEYKPDTFKLEGDLYTGPVALWDDGKLTVAGNLKNGIAEGNWKFYYKSGGLRMEGNLENGLEKGVWRAYYGYDKLRIEKLYDNNGFMIMRKEYWDNGNPKNYQHVKSPLFGDQERRIQFNRKGGVDLVFPDDEVAQFTPEHLAELVEKNGFRVDK